MRYTVSKELERLRSFTKRSTCHGLSDEEVHYFAETDPLLRQALSLAIEELKRLTLEFPDLIHRDEQEVMKLVGASFLNFYPPETSSPYLPLAAKGPWIITFSGAVIYDTGGYGMLGHGHDPECIREALAKPQVMANIMTPSFAQLRVSDRLKKRIGFHHNSGSCPFSKFVFMNSGSEAMGVALRIADAHAKKMTDPGARHAGKKVIAISFEGSFHGRTYRAARISGSSKKKYRAALASFREHTDHREVRVNDSSHLREIVSSVEANHYIEALVFEPVMGEGNPGQPLERAFYDTAREVADAHGSLLIIDSIQAGLRAHGVLSIFDYPGFETAAPPDMEVYSKALNGGQYPLSVLALLESAAAKYASGIYGNTMTAAPRALDVAAKVLDGCSENLRMNISIKGVEFREKLEHLARELPHLITRVQGTGLLLAAELADHIPVVGFDGVEQKLRREGINVIHGGKNALRFTPWFLISSTEIDLIINKMQSVLTKL